MGEITRLGERVRTFSSIRSGSEHWVYASVVNGLEPIDAVQIPTNDLQDLISRYQQCEEMPELLVQIYMSRESPTRLWHSPKSIPRFNYYEAVT